MYLFKKIVTHYFIQITLKQAEKAVSKLKINTIK